MIKLDMNNCVIFLSGAGSNFLNIVDRIKSGFLKGVSISLVVSDKNDAMGLLKARELGFSTHIINEKNNYNELIEKLKNNNTSLIILAGFMQILPHYFVEAFEGKIINLHPSLLPKYKGLDTHKKVLEAGDEYHGASVHFVTSKLDDGPIILQGKTKINKSDTIESLKKRVHSIEYDILPIAIDWFAKKYIKQSKGKCIFNEIILNKPIINL